MRSKNFRSMAEKELFRGYWEDYLNAQYPGKFRVLLEDRGKPNEHFHAQVKKGQKFESL